MVTRRQFLQYSAALLASAALPRRWSTIPSAQAATSAPLLDSTTIPKYTAALTIPPPLPTSNTPVDGIEYFEIAARAFLQQVLPSGYPATPIWGFGSANHPGTFNYPAFSVHARVGTPVMIKWINELTDPTGAFLPHMLAVDPTLHWANPPGPRDVRPDRASFSGPVQPYTGPVPMVPHVHGAHTGPESDGYAEAWFLPAARDLPSSYFRVGSFYDRFRERFETMFPAVRWAPGSATFFYPNDQRAGTLWFHDHTVGMTRLNVHAGPAGFYLLHGGSDDIEDGSLPQGEFEIPLAIQDRSFSVEGDLAYPTSRAEFDGYGGPYIPESDISPIWNPEVFGATMLVNGKTWPNLAVEPRRYRLRILNGCSGRFLILKVVTGDPAAARPITPSLPMWQIGTEGGFIKAPVEQAELRLGPAERADVVLDFTGKAGQTFTLINEGPDEPFGGGSPVLDFPPADPNTTGQVLRFQVSRPLSGPDASLPPAELGLPTFTRLQPQASRKVSLIEMDSDEIPGAGPREALLGTMHEMDGDWMGMPMMWSDPVTETPTAGEVETWEIYNYTMDAHPIHLHQVMFQVLDRQAFEMSSGKLEGTARPLADGESGFKDTVMVYPGEVTRIAARFDLPGRYVWHCHLVEHEDNEMMRPLDVVPPDTEPRPNVIHLPVIPNGRPGTASIP